MNKCNVSNGKENSKYSIGRLSKANTNAANKILTCMQIQASYEKTCEILFI